MRITITVAVHADDGATTTLTVEEDQWRYGRDEDRPIKQVRNRALARAKQALDKAIELSTR